MFSELQFNTFKKRQIICQVSAKCKKFLFVLDGEIWVLRKMARNGSRDYSMEESNDFVDKSQRRMKEENELKRMFPDYKLIQEIRKGFTYSDKNFEKDEQK